MDNIANKYKFDDFTFTNYERLLQLAKSRFKFVGYNIDFEKDDEYIIWRHDIEFSIDNTCRFAQIEKDLNIKSNYFLQLHSEYYNALDKRNVEKIKKYIIRNGHNLGLHFDTSYYNINNIYQLEYYLEKDKKILQDIYEIEIYAFSFHNTNSFTMICEEEEYDGLINVYSKKIKKVPYCSDSLGYWRFDRLEDLLNNEMITKLHVLTHDAMWCDKALSPRQRIKNSIEKDAISLLQYYDTYLKIHGHLNIDC